MAWLIGQALDQHRRGHRHAAGDRRAAAARLQRRLGAAHSLVVLGHAACPSPGAEPGAREALAGPPGLLRRSLAVAARAAPAARPDPAGAAPAGRVTVTSSVLLAGGGSAGHVSPLLALADCLRRRDPATRITALGHRRGPGGPAGAGARLPDRARPEGADAAPSRPDLLRLPGRAAPRPCAPPTGRSPTTGADVGRRVRWLRLHAGVPGRPPARRADRRPRAEPAARPGQPARRPAHAVRRDDVRRHAAAARRPLGHAAARRDRRPATGRGLREAARDELGLDAGPHHPARDRRVAGRAAAQRDLRRQRRPPAGRRGAGRCTSAARASRSTSALSADGEPPYVVLQYFDQMERAYAAADLVVCRSGANTVCELTAVGLPAVVRAAAGRQRRAAAERRAGGDGGRRAAGRRRRVHAGVGAQPCCCRCSRTRPRWPRWDWPPQPWASRTPTSGSPTWCEAAVAGRPRPAGPRPPMTPDDDLTCRRPAGRGAGAGALHRHRRRRHVRHRPR